MDERGLVITLSGDVYFDAGSAKLRDETREVLSKVGDVLAQIPNYVRVEGYTDDSPTSPETAQEGYETNWELSGARAVNTLRYLVEERGVNPKQMSATTYGQYRPIDDNNTPEGRAYHRRVDIVIVKDKIVVPSKHKDISRPLPDEEWR